jgi:hypothetical protein
MRAAQQDVRCPHRVERLRQQIPRGPEPALVVRIARRPRLHEPASASRVHKIHVRHGSLQDADEARAGRIVGVAAGGDGVADEDHAIVDVQRRGGAREPEGREDRESDYG